MATLATALDKLFETQNNRAGAARRMEASEPVRAFANEDIFFHVKRIDNSRVVRAADPQARQACWKMVGSVVAAAVLLIAVLLPGAYSLLAGFQVQALRAEAHRLVNEQASLELREAQLLSPARMEELAKAASLPPLLREQLVVDDDNFVRNTCSYSPFTLIGDEVVSSVTLLSRFAYRCKSLILNRVRRYQIRSGFSFEDSVKAALRRQGFTVTDIKRVGHAEFDVVATLDGVIYNVQCKNNLVDLNRVESDVKRFVRYNRSLDSAYAKALKKEEDRETVLTTKLGLPRIKHLLVSRFPVATANRRVIPFSEIHRFRAIAERL